MKFLELHLKKTNNSPDNDCHCYEMLAILLFLVSTYTDDSRSLAV